MTDKVNKLTQELMDNEGEDAEEVVSLMKHPDIVQDLTNTEWYVALIEELQACLVEFSFSANWALIEGYHHIGNEILAHESQFTQAGYLKASETIAQSLGKSQRQIEQCIQFARKYPDLSLLPMGKAISWHIITRDLLPEHTPEMLESKSKPLTKQDYINILKEIKLLIQHEWEENNKTAIEWRGGGEIGDEAESKCKYIRYLQDQFNKITSEVKL
jgi:hypothetical protein